jgi:glycosyltransferase involved in cell wall biosynthesis
VPEVAEERTNLGPRWDALVTRVKRNQEPLGLDPDYDLLRENFDHANFMLQARTLPGLPDVDPIRHFLRHGADAVNSPNYNFAMRSYLDRHPERGTGPEPSPYLAWLEHGRDAGEIADPAPGIEAMAGVLGLHPAEVVEELVTTRTDMMERLRTGRLGEMFAKAAEIEPLVASVWGETTRTRMIPLGGRFVVGQVAAIHACQATTGFRRARVVVVTDGPQRSGGRSFESHLARGLAESVPPGDVVVVYTDESGSAPEGRFPAGVCEVDFAGAARGLPDEHRQQAFVSLLRSYGADSVVNLGSRLFYRVLTAYGRALASSERMFLCFAGDEPQARTNDDDWSLLWFYAGIDIVAGYLTDSAYVRDRLTDLYQLGDADRARIYLLPVPVRQDAPRARPRAGTPRRPAVCWSGPWDRHAAAGMAFEVARRMPDVDFRFWSEGVVQGSPAGPVPENVRLGTLQAQLSELDLTQTDAWLYTARPNGVPSLLLEVAMTEVPIVAGLVGGVDEVLSEDDSWPVLDADDPAAYEKALRDVLTDPEEARRRSHALRTRLVRERTPEAFAASVVGLLVDHAESPGRR